MLVVSYDLRYIAVVMSVSQSVLRYDQIAKRTVGCSGVCGYVFVFNPGHDSRGQSHSLPIISLGIEGPISVPQHTLLLPGPIEPGGWSP